MKNLIFQDRWNQHMIDILKNMNNVRISKNVEIFSLIFIINYIPLK
jgi:hypothetical protein